MREQTPGEETRCHDLLNGEFSPPTLLITEKKTTERCSHNRNFRRNSSNAATHHVITMEDNSDRMNLYLDEDGDV